MAFCSLKIGLNSGVSQQQITEALNRAGISHIQTSSGLCVKATRENTEKALAEFKSGFSLEAVSEETEIPPDVRAFMDSQ